MTQHVFRQSQVTHDDRDRCLIAQRHPDQLRRQSRLPLQRPMSGFSKRGCGSRREVLGPGHTFKWGAIDLSALAALLQDGCDADTLPGIERTLAKQRLPGWPWLASLGLNPPSTAADQLVSG